MHPFRFNVFILLLILPFVARSAPRSYSIVGKANDKHILFGVIDNSGKIILPCSYTEIRMDAGGYFRTKSSDGVMSVFDAEGTRLFQSSSFMEMGNCGNGLFPVQDKTSELWGFADLQGKIRIAPAYRQAQSFVCGLAVVLLPFAVDEKNTDAARAPRIINVEGKVLLDFSVCPEIHDVTLHPFTDSLVSFTAEANSLSSYMQQADNEVQGFITTRGQLLKKNIFRTHSQFYAIPPAVANMPFVLPLPDEQYCYCAPDGTVIIPGPFGMAHSFSADGIALVADRTGSYYIDRNGKRLYADVQYKVGERMPGGTNLHWQYENNRIPLYSYKKNQTIYIDTKGQVAIKLDSGLNGMDFHEGSAIVWRYVNTEDYTYVWSRIDTTGKIIAPFDTIHGLQNPPLYHGSPSVFYDFSAKHYGLRGADGKILVRPEYGYIEEKTEGVFLVRQGPGNSFGPEMGSMRACGAYNEKGVLITRDYYSFSAFTCFAAEQNPVTAATLNFTATEMGEQIIDVLEIRADVDAMRNFWKEQEQKDKEEKENGDR